MTAWLAIANYSPVTARKPRPSWLVAEPDPPSKRSILDAALRLFVRHGLDGTNIRMIAKESGYTNPAMFKFFASKDALALYLFERCYDRLYRAVAAAARGGTFRQALARVVDAFLAEMDEDLEAVFDKFRARPFRPSWSCLSRRRAAQGRESATALCHEVAREEVYPVRVHDAGLMVLIINARDRCVVQEKPCGAGGGVGQVDGGRQQVIEKGAVADDGDAVVVYDKAANRWIVSQIWIHN